MVNNDFFSKSLYVAVGIFSFFFDLHVLDVDIDTRFAAIYANNRS